MIIRSKQNNKKHTVGLFLEKKKQNKNKNLKERKQVKRETSKYIYILPIEHFKHYLNDFL